MTTEPVILGPETPIAAALAHVRRQDLTPALASMVFVARPPLETPTGRFIGVVHLQRLLREPPHESIGSIVDTDIEAIPVDAPLLAVTRHAGHVQPARRCPSSTPRSGCSAWSRSTTSSTTCCPRTGARPTTRATSPTRACSAAHRARG